MLTLLLLALPFTAALLMVFLRSRSTCRVLAGGTALFQLLVLLFISAIVLIGNSSLDGRESIGAMLAPFESQSVLHALNGSWLSGYHVLSFVGVDAVGLPFLFLLLSGFVGALFLTGRQSNKGTEQHSQHYLLLMMVNGCAVGAITAVNVLLLVLFALATIAFVLGIVWQWGRNDRKHAVRRFLPVGYGAALLLGALLLGVVKSMGEQPDFQERKGQWFTYSALAQQGLQHRSNLNGVQGQEETPSITFVSLGLLFLPAFLLMLFPFHPSLGGVVDSSPDSSSPLLLVLGPALGFPILLHTSFYIFPNFWNDTLGAGVLSGVGICTAIYAGLVGIGERDAKRVLRFFLTGWCGLLVFLLTVPNSAWIAVGLCAILISGVLASMQMVLFNTASYSKAVSRCLGVLPLIAVMFIVAHYVLSSSTVSVQLQTMYPSWWTLAGALVGALLLSVAALRMQYPAGKPSLRHVSDMADRIEIKPVQGWATYAIMFLLFGCLIAGVWLSVHNTAPMLEDVLMRDQEGARTILGCLEEGRSQHCA